MFEHDHRNRCSDGAAARRCPDCAGHLRGDTFQHSPTCPVAASTDQQLADDLRSLLTRPGRGWIDRPITSADADAIEVTTGVRPTIWERRRWSARVGLCPPGVTRLYLRDDLPVCRVTDLSVRRFAA